MNVKTPDQPELALDPAEVAAHGDPEFVDPPAAAADDNDPNDIEGVGEDEPAAPPVIAKEEPKPAPVKADAEAPAEDDDEPKTPEEMKEALAQAKRAVKALTGRLSTTAAEKRRLNEELAKTIKPVAAEGEEPAATPERADFASKAEFDTAVRAEAARIKALDAFNDRCNDIEDKGAKAFGKKWVDAKSQLGILDDQGRIPFDLLNCAMETDNPAMVLFALGQNLDKATELLAMTPLKRAIAMSKMAETKAPAEKPRSQTPPPVEPIGGRGGGDDKPSDRDTDEEWNRKEAIREANQRKARGY